MERKSNDLFTQSHRNLVAGFRQHVEDDQQIKPAPLQNDDLFTKIQLRFSEADQTAIDQIKAASNIVISDLFSGMLDTIDYFYGSFRKPVVNAAGVTRLDHSGRIVWERDDQGRYLDDFEGLSGQDVEEAILKIQRDKMDVAAKVSELHLEALFAKHSFDDAWHDKYHSLLDGTIADKNARANRDTRGTKYLAYFKFYVYNQADVIFSEIANLLRLLERVRQWRVNDSYQERYGSRPGQ